MNSNVWLLVYLTFAYGLSGSASLFIRGEVDEPTDWVFLGKFCYGQGELMTVLFTLLLTYCR